MDILKNYNIKIHNFIILTCISIEIYIDIELNYESRIVFFLIILLSNI